MVLGRLSRTAGEVWPTAVAQGAQVGRKVVDLPVEARVVESRAAAALVKAELAVVPVAVRVEARVEKGMPQVQLQPVQPRELVARRRLLQVCMLRPAWHNQWHVLDVFPS